MKFTLKRIAPRLAALLLAAAVTAHAQPAGGGLPAMGDGDGLTLGAERQLGDRIARELYRDPDYIDDPVLVEYVQSIWQPLLAASRQRGDMSADLADRFAWQVLLGRDRTVNAFALPGGYFGLHLGLIGVTTQRDELASVLAHELTHVTQRHIARQMAAQAQQTPWVIAGMILGALAAAKNPQAAQALVVGTPAAAAQSQLNYSRDMEREADRIGFGVATQAGFAGQGFASLFDKLQQANRINDNGSWPYLRSHPLTTERMADMQQRLSFAPAGQTAAASAAAQPEADALHALMAARARVLSRPGVDTWRAWSAEADSAQLPGQPPARRAAVLYAAALSAAQLGAHARAQDLAARLMSAVAGQPALARQARLLQAELALQGGDAVRAAQALGAVSAPRFQGLTPPALRGTKAAAAQKPAPATRPAEAPDHAPASASAAATAHAGTPAAAPTRTAPEDSRTKPAAAQQTAPSPPQVLAGRPEMLMLADARTRIQTGGAGLAGLRPDTVATAAVLSVSQTGGVAGGLAASADALQNWVLREPRDATAWQTLAAVRTAQGQPLRAIRAEAEAQAARLDLAAAIDRLKAGQDLARQRAGVAQPAENIEAAIIDSRLRELESALGQQSLQR